MTFDFTPDWMMTLFQDGSYSPAASAANAWPTTITSTTTADLAALVQELFAEGSLSWEQLRSLVELPELGQHLRPTLAAAPPARRLSIKR